MPDTNNLLLADYANEVELSTALGKGRRTHGHSLVISPWGEILSDAGTEPGVSFVDLDMAKVTSARARIPSLTHDRRFSGP